MKPIVIGIGEFLWDVLPSGKKAGGAPVNFAYHASQNGVEGWGISAVGDDALGEELCAEARKHNINLCVEKINYPTSTVQVELKDGIPSFTIIENVAWDYMPLSDKALELAKNAAAISFGTLAQRSETARKTTQAIIAATPVSALRVYDINLRQKYYSKELIEENLSLANVFKINDEELEILKNLFGIENLSIDEACRFFIEQFDLKMLILTAGAEYSSIYYGDKISTIPTPKVEVVDTVGAGDSFSGAFVGAVLSGKTIEEAHRIAVDTAAYVCTKAGAWI